jgi:hypothetical protein
LIHQLGALKDIDDVLPALNENVLLAMAPDPGKFGKKNSDIFRQCYEPRVSSCFLLIFQFSKGVLPMISPPQW